MSSGRAPCAKDADRIASDPHADIDAEFETLVYRDEASVFNPPGMLTHYVGERMRRPAWNVLWHQTVLPMSSRERRYDVLFLPAGNRRVPAYAPCPTVGTVHDLAAIHVRGKYDRARTLYINHVLPFLIRRLTSVITVSESSKRDIVEHARVPERRVRVIPLAADTALFHPAEMTVRDSSTLCAKYGIRPPYVLYVSRIEHPGKNHVRLIRAFDRLKSRERIPHQLVLAGSDWTRADEVHRVARGCGCADDIVFTGFAARADLPALYRCAQLFVFPSLFEGFGLPVLEAMACGTPVTCSDRSSIPEVVGDAGVLFDPYDEESIAHGMTTLLTDDVSRARYRRLGLERARLFSWSSTARQTLAVLREACA